MIKEFIPYEQALALKELGFDEPCFGFYSKIHGLITGQTNGKGSLLEHAGECLAPLYQQAFRWFRDNYELDHYIKKSYDFKKYFYTITKDGIIIDGTNAYDIADSYEEAERACLDRLIQICKNK